MYRSIATITVALAVSLVAGCGGSSSKGAASATAVTRASTLSVSQVAGDGAASKFGVSGPAYGFFDGSSQTFHVLVIDAASGPAPDCDHLKELARSAKGRFVDVWLGKNVTASGKVDAAGALTVDASTGTPQMAMATIDGVAFDFKSVDAKSFDADVVSASGSASGSLHGTVCDASKLSPGGNDATALNVPPPPPPNTESHETNVVDIAFPDGKHQVTSGPGAIAKLDPKAKTLGIYVWDELFEPSPTCEAFGDGAKNAQQGGLAYLGLEKFPARKTGKFTVGGGQFFTTGLDPSQEMYGAGLFDGTTIEITQFDDGALVGKISSSPDAKTQVSGRLVAQVCPDGPVVFPSQKKDKPKSKPAKSGKKKK